MSEVSTLAKPGVPYIHRATDRSITLRVLQQILGLFNTSLFDGLSPHREIDGSPELPIPMKTRHRFNVSDEVVQGIFTYCIQRDTTQPIKHKIFYIAGGSWEQGPTREHYKFLTQLLLDLPRTTAFVIISTPLVPKNPAPKTYPILLDFCKAVFRETRSQNQIVSFAGDSSGGNLVLSLTLELLKSNDSTILPHAIILICPTVDLSHKNPDQVAAQWHDPLLRLPTSRRYASEWASTWSIAKDPRISPILATNLSQLVAQHIAVYGIVGTHDILAPDALIFAERLEKEGVEGRWLVGEGCMHCWVLMGGYAKFCVEVKTGFEWVVDAMREAGERGKADGVGVAEDGSV
jgi:acetyl esterase/lipase